MKKSKQERPFVDFWNKHKKVISIVSGVVGVAVVSAICILGIRYSTSFERWFNKATLEELNTVRANIQTEYLNPKGDEQYRCSLWDLMKRFDTRIEELKWGGCKPVGPAYYPEHGSHLYKPE
ncbi:MAG: hypothetical protein ACI4MS_01990 [Candidatus Coproplasma sp.]